jgi:preprotein translocase subunit SecA
VVVAERHLLRRHDDHVTRFAEGLGLAARVTVHLALADELMKRFVGQWVADTLRQLGVQPDEAIESGMVTRQIRKAQDKMRSIVTEDDKPADSPAEWMRLNVRS